MLNVVMVVCGVLATLGAIYGLYFVVTAFPLNPKPDKGVLAPNVTHKFAILIFAKNEAAVIGQLVESLQEQNYPREAYDIYVTADNCTDDTAAIAARCGAIVWERTDPSRLGKGNAMRWFFERFRVDCAHRYDACAVFDADNIVHPQFLSAMNRQLNLGYEISIGYRLSKNPSDSAVASTSALFWLFQTRLFYIGRVHRGYPCTTVGGPGFVFDLAVLPEGLWPTQSPFEDIEFTLLSIADGRTISFTHDAIFYDEQPITWRQSLQQRYRWNVDILLMLRYGTPALLQTFRQRWRTTYDALIFSVGGVIPALSMIASFVMTMLFGIETGQWLAIGVSTLVGAAVGYVAIAAVARWVLALEHQWWPGAWKGVAVFPVFLWTSAMISIFVLFYHSSRPGSTPHTQALTLDDVMRAQFAGTPEVGAPEVDG